MVVMVAMEEGEETAALAISAAQQFLVFLIAEVVLDAVGMVVQADPAVTAETVGWAAPVAPFF
jgi:hypothetical protein